MTYEDFKYEVVEACMRKAYNNTEVQRDIIEIIDNYYQLGTVQLLTHIPAILVLTKREHALEFTLTRVNGWVELKTPNFTFKIS